MGFFFHISNTWLSGLSFMLTLRIKSSIFGEASRRKMPTKKSITAVARR